MIGTACDQQVCMFTEILLTSGLCEPCLPYYFVDTWGVNCIQESCSISLGQYLGKDGKCVFCSDYTYATQSACIKEECTPRQYLRIDGKCIDCQDYFHVSEDGKQCIQEECEEREIHDIEGKCVECADYTYADKVFEECKADTCTSREFQTPLGVCSACPDFEAVSDLGFSCVQADCTNRYNQYLTIDGNCAICEFYFYRDETGKACT